MQMSLAKLGRTLEDLLGKEVPHLSKLQIRVGAEARSVTINRKQL